MSQSAPYQPDEPPIDMQEFTYLKEDMEDTMPMLVARFLENLPEYVAKCQSTYANKQWLDLKREAHSLKGASQYVGASLLSRHCLALERLSGTETFDRTEAETLLSILQQESLRVAEALTRLMAEE